MTVGRRLGAGLLRLLFRLGFAAALCLLRPRGGASVGGGGGGRPEAVRVLPVAVVADPAAVRLLAAGARGTVIERGTCEHSDSGNGTPAKSCISTILQ